MTDSGGTDHSSDEAVPAVPPPPPSGDGGGPLPPIAPSSDPVLPPIAPSSDPVLLPPPTGVEPTLLQPVTAAGAAAGGGAAIPPPGGSGGSGQPPSDDDDYYDADDDDGAEGTGRPAWLIPAAAGLGVGLIVALGIFAFMRDDDDPVATGLDTRITPVLDTTVDTEVAVTPTDPADTAATTATTATDAPDTAAPDTAAQDTAPSETPAPAPETTMSPNGIPIATDGFVRIVDMEYPIIRVCLANPVVGYSVLSYLYENNGVFEIVEWTQDEGIDPGATFAGEGYEVEDFGDDGFGMLAFQGDSEFAVSVNPAGFGVDECPGTLAATDPTNPEFTENSTIVDICLGEVAAFDDSGEFRVAFGYRALMTENATFTALPNADGSLDLDFTASYATFSGNDPAATTLDFAAGFELRGTAVGNPGGTYDGESRELLASVAQDFVRICTEIE